tara:strand:- start:2413 stop:2604 length:192 start_codon:yes stop_codon:yes gene_type:complete
MKHRYSRENDFEVPNAYAERRTTSLEYVEFSGKNDGVHNGDNNVEDTEGVGIGSKFTIECSSV